MTVAIWNDIAGFLSALLTVYTLCIIAWIVFSLLFSFGIRIPYNRASNGILNFLRDVTEPYLGLFRRLGLRVGPVDFSPLIALLVLSFVGGLVVTLVASLD